MGKLTHAVFAFIHMDSEGKLQFKTNQKERFEKLKTAVKNANSDTKVMISIGGDHNSENFGSVLSDSEKKSMFIDSIARFIRQHKIHGVDIYWKWLGNSETEHHDFPSFLKDLKEKLKTVRDDSIISIVAPQAKMDRRHDGYKFDDFMEYIDFVNVFSMDYYGPWPNQWGTPTGPSAPLYGGIGVKKHFNVDSTMKYYTCMTEDPSKFNMVIPFYVRLWKNVKEPISSGTEVFRRADLKNGAAVGNSYMSRWTVDHEGWELTPALWDDVTKTPYVWNQETGNFLTFENKKSIEAKLAYAIEHNLGGVWIHLVDKDNENEELLRAVASKKFCASESENKVTYDC